MSNYFYRIFSTINSKKILLLLPALIALVYIPSQVYPFSGIKAYFFIGILSMLGMVFGIRKLFSKETSIISFSKLDIFLVVVVVGMCITSIFGIDPQLSFFSTLDRGVGVVLWVWVIVYYLAVKNLIKKDVTVLRVVDWGLMCTGVIISLSVWGATYGFLPRMFLGGLQGNSSLAGTVLLLCVPSFLYLVYCLKNEKKVAQMFGVLLLLLFTITCPLFISQSGIGESRGVVLSVGIALIFSSGFYFLFSNKKMIAWASRAFLSVLVGICIVCMALVVKEGSTLNLFFKNHSGANRLLFWDTAFQAIHERPFLGHGNETFEYSFFKHFDPVVYREKEGWVDKPHNAYIEMIHDNGVIVFALYVISIGYCYYLLYRLGKNKENRIEARIYFFVLTAYLFQNTLVFDNSTTLVLLSVLLARLSRDEKNEHAISASPLAIGCMVVASCFSLYFLSILPFVEGNRVSHFMRHPVSYLDNSARSLFSTSGVSGSAYLAHNIMNYIERDTKTTQNNYSPMLYFLIREVLKDGHSEYSFPAQLFASRAYTYIYEKTKDPSYLKNAQMYAENALRISKTNPEGYWVFAYAYALGGNEKESLLAARTVVELDPMLEEGYSRMVFLARFFGNKNVEKGTIEDARRYFPDFDKTE